jgi:uncharacterized repeat protein (TIGR01451 family)/LPXTG-motif cell wall-anchored protein
VERNKGGECEMKKLIAAVKRAPKSAALVSMLAAAIVVPVALFAWGPDRPTYTVASPADHVTFNSITDNPNYGDERDFITVKDPATGNFTNNLNVQPGKEYEVRVLAHNNAASNLNLKAINTELKTVVSQATSKKNAITAYLSADNAQPQKIYDDVYFSSDKDFNLAYVAGSARVYNNGYAAGGQGKPFSDSLVTSAGAKLGYEAEGDGKIPGCFQYINYVYFKVKPQFAPTPDFAVQKKVSEAGKNNWVENLTVKAEQTVDYRVEYKNTGTTQQDNVVVKDQLPAGMTYVAGTSKLYNTQNPKGKTLTDGIVDTKGVNIGSHAAGANSFVVFQAKVAKNADLAKCGANTLTNKATVDTDNGSKSDTADVMVTKTCVPGTPEVPTTPTELPKTGASDGILGLFGLGSVVAAASYYVASRRQN